MKTQTKKFIAAGIAALILTIAIAYVIFACIMEPFLQLQYEKIDNKYKDAARRMIANTPELDPALRLTYWRFMDDETAVKISTAEGKIKPYIISVETLPYLKRYVTACFIIMAIVCCLITFLIMGFLKGTVVSIEEARR